MPETALQRLERKAKIALMEAREGMGTTDATRARSTARRKTKAEKAADVARVDAFCEAVFILTGELTPMAVWLRLNAEVEREQREFEAEAVS